MIFADIAPGVLSYHDIRQMFAHVLVAINIGSTGTLGVFTPVPSSPRGAILIQTILAFSGTDVARGVKITFTSLDPDGNAILCLTVLHTNVGGIEQHPIRSFFHRIGSSDGAIMVPSDQFHSQRRLEDPDCSLSFGLQLRHPPPIGHAIQFDYGQTEELQESGFQDSTGSLVRIARHF